jgi:hypothetical protein
VRVPFHVRYSDARGDATTAEKDIVFTVNLPSARARGVCFPEISLVAAIFEDAVRCARRANGGVTHRDSSEAVEWIASERSDWPFAFVNVCEFLGVDAQVVRARLGAHEKLDPPRAGVSEKWTP